jgi:hypothetical protein
MRQGAEGLRDPVRKSHFKRWGNYAVTATEATNLLFAS